MIVSILINGIRGALKEIIVVTNGVYKLFEMPSWKAICQDTIPSHNTGNTEVQNIGGSLAGEKEKREGR